MGRISVMLQVLGGRLHDFFRQASRPWCGHRGIAQRNVLEPAYPSHQCKCLHAQRNSSNAQHL